MFPKSGVSPTGALRRSAVALAVGLVVATSAVHAQQTAGSISGHAAKGDVVTVSSKAIGITRQSAVDAGGAYAISQLPGGEYTVTVKRADGSTSSRTVVVAPGQGAVADFQQLEQVVVTGASIKTIDTKSTESVQSLSKAAIDRIPVSRDTTAITMLAPGATQGDGRIGATSARGGNVASLGGASPA
ncbi:MAG TPA: carboxypeptidase-like regulatory domain-containing protein, partial [Burkholderiaceae bacterium]